MAREPVKQIARLKASQISYESGYERTIDLAGVRGDVVVIMGEEVTHPDEDAPYAGKIEHRRFTGVWKQVWWRLEISDPRLVAAESSFELVCVPKPV